jgi:hypothetical protein
LCYDGRADRSLPLLSHSAYIRSKCFSLLSFLNSLLPFLPVQLLIQSTNSLTMAAIDVEDVLSKLTNPQKISLLSGKPPRTETTTQSHLPQVSTSGTPRQSPNTASPPSASPTAPTASAAPDSSMASPPPASRAAPPWARHGTLHSSAKRVQ